MKSIPTRHERIIGDGVDLHVAVSGNGPPVILLHGFPENGDSWRHQIAPLIEAGFSTWVPDMRGYRFSGRPLQEQAYRLPHLVEDVAAIARATGHAHFNLVGHDWGGIVAWSFAHAHPGSLDNLVIMNAPHMRLYRKRLWRSRQWLRSWYAGGFLLPWLPERILSAFDYKAIRAMFRLSSMRTGAYTDDQIASYVSSLSKPRALTAALNYYRANLGSGHASLEHLMPVMTRTLMIWGVRDPALDISLLDGLHDVAPNAQIHRIEEASHWVQNEAPEEVNRLMIDFLASNQTSLKGLSLPPLQFDGDIAVQ